MVGYWSQVKEEQPMKEEPGYIQAVENLAFAVSKLAEVSIDGNIDNIRSPADAEAFMTDEEMAEWQKLDNIIHTVCDTYQKDLGTVTADVWFTMMENDLQIVH
jgi:hypothetical protein